MRVYGGQKFKNGTQLRTIVAAKSKKKAAELVGESLHQFRQYWSETGNDIEIKTALKMPGVVFQASTSMGKDFMPV